MKSLRAAFILVLLAACGSETQSTPSASGSGSARKAKTSARASSRPAVSTPAASTPPLGSASVSTSAEPAGDEHKGKMANCPNAAPNAKTEFKDNAKGVEVSVTAKDKADVDEIRKRSKDLMEKAKAEGGAKVPHSGTGGGGGSQGRCPIVLNATDVTVADVEGGSKFTIVAKDAKEVDWVRREAKERLAAMAEPGADAKGAGKMVNCPSAVSGSKTTVKEDKGNVVLTITAKDEAATKDIRERAKKLGDMKHDAPKKGEHGGKGAGAEEGRCPAVIEGATATVKDVEGGSEITLKPKTPGDLKKLLAEATERAGRFD